MSTYVGKERSTIIPPENPQQLKKVLKFTYSTAEYDSYAKNGFVPPEIYHRLDKFEQWFIGAADPGKGPVKVRINNIVRLRAIDYSEVTEPKREYIYWNSDWEAKNWLGQKIFVRQHIEGKYMEQIKILKLGEINPNTGVQDSYYEKGVPRLTYSIPFTKKNVDDILHNKKPFGPDSMNITDIDSMVFYGKFENSGGRPGFPCNGFTYDQFLTPWKEFEALARRPGGPTGTAPIFKYNDKDTPIK